MNYSLTISPAIPIDHRHKLIDTIEKLGYNVWASGQNADGLECDIAFDDKDAPLVDQYTNSPNLNNGKSEEEIESANRCSL
jgi:hypothetical protein